MINKNSTRDEVLEVVKYYGDALEYASEELRGDREVVMEAVKQDGDALQYASEELRGDREVVMEAVKQNAYALFYASEELQDDLKKEIGGSWIKSIKKDKKWKKYLIINLNRI